MATTLDNLNTAYANAAANLALITQNPKPSYSIDGVSYSWGELHSFYTSQLKTMHDNVIMESGPYQQRSRGVV